LRKPRVLKVPLADEGFELIAAFSGMRLKAEPCPILTSTTPANSLSASSGLITNHGTNATTTEATTTTASTTTTATPTTPDAKPPKKKNFFAKLTPGGPQSFPLPLLILGALAILLVIAGAAGMIWRRYQDREPGEPGTP
jgi:hypothetical protein